MGRIRLQIRVMPWEQPRSSLSSSAQTRQEILKWCEPCPENTPMQEVCDRIYESWGRMFKASEGPLSIRHLKTAYGELVDIERRVVGDLFDDRGTDPNLLNSILEVHRYTPDQDQLETIQRFSSLAPDSSARPHKRPLELSSQSYPSQSSRNMHREVPSIEAWDAETIGPFPTAAKRQCTRESRLNRTFEAHQPMNMREEHRGGLCHSSQTSGTQESIHQVADSQKSPGRKQLNPYGTPTSLPLLGPQESVPGNEVDLSAIPDSPLGKEDGFSGKLLQLDGESTKSESPELRASVHESQPASPIDATDRRPTASADSPEPATSPFIFKSTSRPASIPQIVDDYAKNHSLAVEQSGEKAADVNRTSKRRPSTSDPAQAQNVRGNSDVLCKSDPIFDPIESDTESFHEKQRMQSAKRLRSGKAPTAGFTSPRASNQAGVNRRDGRFLVPPIPQSRTNGVRTSLGEFTSPEQREDIQEPRQDSEDADKSVQNDLERQGKRDTESLERARSEPCDKDLTKPIQEASKRSLVPNDIVDAPNIPSQATTTWSKGYPSSADGNGDSVVQQGGNWVSSRELEPDGTARLGHDTDVVAQIPDNCRLTQEAERLAEVAEEQQKKKIREKKAEENNMAQQTMEKQNAAKKEATERKANEKGPENGKGGKKEETRAAEFTQAKKAKADEEELAEAKRIKEIRVKAARLAEEKRISERLAREQQTRELALAEEAKKAMLAAEGAKQIEAEKTEKLKARHKELAAEKQANRAKADEQAKEAQGKGREQKARGERLSREKAQQLADLEPKDAEQRTHQVGTAPQTATALKGHAPKSLNDRDVQNVKALSVRRNRNSTTPLNTTGPKRSMTPAIPGSSVAKSSPQQISMGSSPLSTRSSANMDAPLRSALRQTPSALRRSVSSVSFDVPPRSKLNEYIPSTPHPEILEDTNDKIPTKTSSPTNPVETSSGTVANVSSNKPLSMSIPKKARDSKVTKPPAKSISVPKSAPDSKNTRLPAKTGKVQTTLNVTREVKKLKGRAVNTPITSTPAQKPEIVISSGEDSSSSEEPVWQTGNAKAGPSSRKPTFPTTTSQGEKTTIVKTPSAPIDPTIRNLKVENDRKPAPAAVSRSNSKSDPTPLHKSTSRSPALALSETRSLSSDSASSSASDPGSDLESASEEEHQAPSSKTPTGAKNGNPAPVTTKGAGKAINVGVKQTEAYSKSKAPSQSSQASSSRSSNTTSMKNDSTPSQSSQASCSRSSNTTSMKSDSTHANQTADNQPQLESRQSVPGFRNKEASATTNGAAEDKIINQGLNHAGRLPNGIRPANYKYPRFSDLQRLTPEAEPAAKPGLDASSSQPLGSSLAGRVGPDDLSSDSGYSSSNSDEDEDIDELPSQTSSKTEFGPKSGLMRLIKSN
ncbi:hypothetical protein IMSHALPRED_001829 [Imshaugia aleurites]|uniref:Uncharacterized protein n=1 Tax=Imshaugia aleurites TaxID=172621 RepID=A0A8H3J422_9LECA|nr:hypothetical protein IMSHALPRED_001829 [Imshaugia aleurites]